MKTNLKDKVVLIVGAMDEIGEAVAFRLAAEGARLALCDRDDVRLKVLAEEIARRGGVAAAFEVNACDHAMIAACVGRIVVHYGGIDVLVNKAEDPVDRVLDAITQEDFDAGVSAALGSAFHFMRAVVPVMREKSYGRVVNISSLAYLGQAGKAGVAAAQAGLFGLTRSVALETARHNITVNGVVKGDIGTAALSQEASDKLANGIPVKRVGTPADVANAVQFFASDSAKYITGQTFFVCGGKSAYSSMSI